MMKMVFAFLCCTALMVSAASAQSAKSGPIHDPTNDGPPAGPILDLSGTPIPGGGNQTYQMYTVNFTATLDMTAITFAFRDDPAYVSFAGASVVDLTNSSGNLLTNGDFSVGDTGTNTPTGWTYANGYGASFGGLVDPNCGVGSDGSYGSGNCWFDGAVQAYDAISQTISTTAGDTYQITFYVAESSGCGVDNQHGLPCNFSDLSTDGDTADTGGNGIDVAVYAQGGLPPAATQPGSPITPSSGLTQSIVLNNAQNNQLVFNFDYSVPGNNGDLTVQPGTNPFASVSGVDETTWASIVKGTAMADTSCLQATGQGTGNLLCAAYTYTCTTSSSATPLGSNCPTSTARNILFSQLTDLVQNQSGITNGILSIPSGYAPGLAMLPDFLTPNSQCSFPSDSLQVGQLCPQNIMTQLADGTSKPGGTTLAPNSTFVFFCCEPEWTTTPAVPLWSNSISVPVSFTSAPPTTPNGDNNSFQAAQGAAVVVGAELASLDPLDTTYPIPGEQSLPNPTACPALPTTWSAQGSPQAFTTSGTIFNYYNGSTTSSLTEGGPYNAHFFSVDCDGFEELVYPATLDVTPSTPGAQSGPNVVTFHEVPFYIDLTAPTVAVTPPGSSPSGSYALNSVLTVSITCTDPVSPATNGVASGIATCGPLSSSNPAPTVYPSSTNSSPQPYTPGSTNPNPPTYVVSVTLPTSPAGAYSYSFVAVDQAGNQTPTPLVISYTVGGTITITASSGSMTYGGTVPTISPSYGGLGSSPLTTLPTCNTTATSHSPAGGGYTSSCSGAVAPAGYTITYYGGTVTIQQAPLKITASSATISYGSPVPAITPSYSGFVNSDGPGNLTTPPHCTTTATSTTSGISSCTGAVDTNYTISYVNGTVTVTPPTLTLSVTPASLTFGSATKPLYPGQSGVPQFVTVKNTGSTSIVISSVTIGGTNAKDFGDLSFCSYFSKPPGTLPAGKSCAIGVDAWLVSAPSPASSTTPFTATAYLAVTPSGGSATDVSLTTYVINPKATLSSSKLTFSASGAQTVTVTNTGTTPLIFATKAITISGNSDFKLTSTTCNGATVEPAGVTGVTSCTISVTFTAPSPKPRSPVTGTVTVTDNAQNSSQTISLSGT